jgi:hypothetical protein
MFNTLPNRVMRFENLIPQLEGRMSLQCKPRQKQLCMW